MRAALILCFVTAVVSASPEAEATPLSELAAELEPGGWAELPTQGFDSALLDDSGGYHLFQYTEDIVWDAIGAQLLFVGGGHGSDAGFIVYDEASNAWSSIPLGWGGSFSHAYDHNAIDVVNRRFYHRRPASDRVEVWDIDSQMWTATTQLSLGYYECCLAIEVFPELGGLMWVDPFEGIHVYDHGSETWSTVVADTQLPSYHTFAEYSPIDKVLIFGGGNGDGADARDLYRLDAQGVVTRMADAAFDLGTTTSIVTVDPNSGKFLIFATSGEYFEYDALTDTWLTQPGMPAFMSFGEGGVWDTVATPISNHGVVLFAKYAGDESKVFLYRHSPGSGTPAPTGSGGSSSASGATTGSGSGGNVSVSAGAGGSAGNQAASGGEQSGCACSTSPSSGRWEWLLLLGLVICALARRLDALVAVALAALVACGGDDAANNGQTASGPSGSGAGTTTSNGAGGNAGSGNGGIGGADGPLKAFPEAEGFGSETPGGRGGAIYVVTTLADDGPGSLREALLATEPRIIVFRVSGVIELGESIALGEENSYVTVAGQTSPGGITIAGSGDVENYQNNFHDGVFRFLRFRGRDRYDNISFNTTHHLVLDHCDFSGATDETFDITFASDITVQWCTITNSQTNGQNYGMLLAYEPNTNITLHHNFHAHHAGRCLADMHWGDGGPPPAGAILELRNNVVYNCSFEVPLWTDNYQLGTVNFNFVGNHFKPGPDTPGCCGMFRLTDSMQAFEEDNTYGALPPFSNSGFTLVNQPFAAPAVTTSSAEQAIDDVLKKAGAWPRDPMNERTVNEAETGTGTLGKIDDALIESGPEPPADDDNDGMPNDWEIAESLDPNDASDAAGDSDGDGYTNVEEYLAGLARSLIPQ